MPYDTAINIYFHKIPEVVDGSGSGGFTTLEELAPSSHLTFTAQSGPFTVGTYAKNNHIVHYK